MGNYIIVNIIVILCVIVHEGTLVHAVSVMSQWTARLNVEVPAALKDWLKKAFTLKSSTSAVRHAYLQVMLRAFKGQQLCFVIFIIYLFKMFIGRPFVVFKFVFDTLKLNF